mmetsp:Transcript_102507/g.272708  ORF Transcript_102507/g.272708 Transcript_102507/m.272708 type:complete len:586 (-) Transcript_102507:634-2391(-)
MHIRAVANEEELPPHLHVFVVEVLRRGHDAPDEEQSDADDPEENGQDADDRHAVPLGGGAGDAAVRLQGGRAIGVWAALEDCEGRLGDARKEGEDQREEAVQGPVRLHLEGGVAPADQLRDAPDEDVHEREETRSQGPHDEQGLEVAEARATRPEDGCHVAGVLEDVHDLAHGRRPRQVGCLEDVRNLIVVQEDEHAGRGAVLPRSPPCVAVAEELVERNDQDRAQDEWRDGEEQRRDLRAAAGGAPLAIPNVVLVAVSAALVVQLGGASFPGSPASRAALAALAAEDPEGLLRAGPVARVHQWYDGVPLGERSLVAQGVRALWARHALLARQAGVAVRRVAVESFTADAAVHAGGADVGGDEALQATVARHLSVRGGKLPQATARALLLARLRRLLAHRALGALGLTLRGLEGSREALRALVGRLRRDALGHAPRRAPSTALRLNSRLHPLARGRHDALAHLARRLFRQPLLGTQQPDVRVVVQPLAHELLHDVHRATQADVVLEDRLEELGRQFVVLKHGQRTPHVQVGAVRGGVDGPLLQLDDVHGSPEVARQALDLVVRREDHGRRPLVGEQCVGPPPVEH